jgi:hypothetical protein
MELMPAAENFEWGNWWRLSTTLIVQFARALGYRDIAVTTHTHKCLMPSAEVPFFTVVARKE